LHGLSADQSLPTPGDQLRRSRLLRARIFPFAAIDQLDLMFMMRDRGGGVAGMRVSCVAIANFYWLGHRTQSPLLIRLGEDER